MTNPNIEQMREMLIERVIDNAETDNDVRKLLYDLLKEGCRGWDNYDDDFIEEQFNMHFEEDYFEIQDEKDHKNGLYG